MKCPKFQTPSASKDHPLKDHLRNSDTGQLPISARISLPRAVRAFKMRLL